MDQITPDSAETRTLLEQARSGDPHAVDQLLARHRPYLREVIEMRMDRKLRARVGRPHRTLQGPSRNCTGGIDLCRLAFVVQFLLGEFSWRRPLQFGANSAHRRRRLCIELRSP